jgi:hypothetical protein
MILKSKDPGIAAAEAAKKRLNRPVILPFKVKDD